MNEEIRQMIEDLEHQAFIAEINRRKNLLRDELSDFEYKLRIYLEKEQRTEKDYQHYLAALEKRDNTLAKLAQLSSCTFATPAPPTSFKEFQTMEYEYFAYTKEFTYDE